MSRKILLSGILLLWLSFCGWAQQFSVKSNLLYDATGSVNVGFESPFFDNHHWSLDLSGHLNVFEHRSGAFWKHAYVQPEFRYWLCDQFSGHFFGLHAHGGIFNVGDIRNGRSLLGTDLTVLDGNRYQGWFIGVGVGYGYAWILGEHWNVECEIGAGYSYAPHDKFECGVCGDTVYEDRAYHYFGITKAAVSLVYFF